MPKPQALCRMAKPPHTSLVVKSAVVACLQVRIQLTGPNNLVPWEVISIEEGSSITATIKIINPQAERLSECTISWGRNIPLRTLTVQELGVAQAAGLQLTSPVYNLPGSDQVSVSVKSSTYGDAVVARSNAELQVMMAALP